jgi:hypothetical protein
MLPRQFCHKVSRIHGILKRKVAESVAQARDQYQTHVAFFGVGPLHMSSSLQESLVSSFFLLTAFHFFTSNLLPLVEPEAAAGAEASCGSSVSDIPVVKLRSSWKSRQSFFFQLSSPSTLKNIQREPTESNVR